MGFLLAGNAVQQDRDGFVVWRCICNNMWMKQHNVSTEKPMQLVPTRVQGAFVHHAAICVGTTDNDRNQIGKRSLTATILVQIMWVCWLCFATTSEVGIRMGTM
jgi:hypothetical protein